MTLRRALPFFFACIIFAYSATADAAPKRKRLKRTQTPTIEEIEDQVYDTPGFSLGLVLGEPTAVTGKHWFGPRSAIDFGAGLSFADAMIVYGDYLYHLNDAFRGDSDFVQALTPYLGGGVLVAISTKDQNKNRAFFRKSTESTGLGIRAVLGLEWRPDEPPLGVFIEAGPGLSLVPNAVAFMHAGIGARYYF